MSYSLEITGKAVDEIRRAAEFIPAGTPINIAFLGNETHAQRFNAAQVIRSYGFEPVPILSARRLLSPDDARAVIGGYQDAATPGSFILVGGDPATPCGPYADATQFLKSGIARQMGIERLGIVAYPEGHPAIADAALWDSLMWKTQVLRDKGIDCEITTQYVLDPDIIPVWLAAVRGRGITNHIRIGVPAPSPARRLLAYARQFGTRADDAILDRYGMEINNAEGLVSPERFMTRLAEGLGTARTGNIGLHVYPFGGIKVAVDWARSLPSFWQAVRLGVS